MADSLYAFAQSSESREAGLRSRAAAAEIGWYREKAAGARLDAALEEAEGLVAQVRWKWGWCVHGAVFFFVGIAGRCVGF